MKNPYRPMSVRIEDLNVENEARDIKTFKLGFIDKNDEKEFSYLPGQFAELSILGSGECPIGAKAPDFVPPMRLQGVEVTIPGAKVDHPFRCGR